MQKKPTSTPPVTLFQTPSNPAYHLHLPDTRLREPTAANGSGKSYWGPCDAKKDFVSCSPDCWSVWHHSRGSCTSSIRTGGCILLLLWERWNGGRDPTEQQRPLGASCPLPSGPSSPEITAVELRGGEWQGKSLLPVTNKPSAKVYWLRSLPIPGPVILAAYLKLGNPEEQWAREAVCQEPPALVGIFCEGLFV